MCVLGLYGGRVTSPALLLVPMLAVGEAPCLNNIFLCCLLRTYGVGLSHQRLVQFHCLNALQSDWP